MEENIHEHSLDDFVRKSFEDHEERPPADMWLRVEGDLLPPAEAPGLLLLIRNYAWQSLAAIVIVVLFSMLVCEHLYYEEKLRNLTAQPAGVQESLIKAKGMQVEPGTVRQDQPAPIQAPAALLKSSTKAVHPIKSNHLERLTVPARVEKSPASERTFVPDHAGLSPSVEPLPISKNEIKSPDFIPNGSLESEIPSSAELPSAATPITLEWAPIPTALLKLPDPASPALVQIPIKPLRHPSGWYVGLQASLLNMIEKTPPPVARPGRHAFASQKERAGLSSICWIKAGKNLNNRFSLETGIGYQASTRTATHTPRFRFGDGTHQGPMGTRRNFNYDLSTYGGTAEVSLRMEVTSPGAPDDEPVSLKISTQERNELIRIPILAGYRFGEGRLQGQLKAGLVANIVLKNELDISGWVSQNARLQPEAGRDNYTVQLDGKKFSLGYCLSAAATFRLNQRLSLVAEPTLLADFPRHDQYRHRLPERFMLGLNVGANYYF